MWWMWMLIGFFFGIPVSFFILAFLLACSVQQEQPNINQNLVDIESGIKNDTFL